MYLKKKILRNDFIAVIPARYNSSRLPGKPLIRIAGIPMIIRTYLQCIKVIDKKIVYVATDNIKIKKLCEENQIKVIMTKKSCLTGSDRIAEVAKKIKKKFYINIQGDEPICNPADIKKIVLEAIKFPNEIINGYTPIKDKTLFHSGHIPKVVFRNDGRLLYQSRAGIPTTKKKEFIKSWRQVCLYSIPYEKLIEFAKHKKTLLERLEDCELNRFLELGFEVKMIRMSDKSISVDTLNNLKVLNRILKKR